MNAWEWLDKHGAAVAAILGSAVTFILTVVVAFLLWDRIGDVSDDVRNLRGEVASARALDSGRIESVANRLDTSATRLDKILDESKAANEGIASLLNKGDKQDERLIAMEKIVASGVTDMTVVLRLMQGESHFALTNFATKTHNTPSEQAGVANVMIGAKLYHGGELRLYPPNPNVATVLEANGWRPAATGDARQGYIFEPGSP